MPQKRVPALSYIRTNAAMPGDNFVAQWNSLTDKDKADLKQWAEDEQTLLGAE